MTNPNPNQRGTQIKDLSVIVGRWSLDGQRRGRYPVNVSRYNFSYTKNELSNYSTERHKLKK